MPPRIQIPGLPYLIGSTNKLLRDNIRRQTVAAFEVDRALFKAITSDKQLPFEVRQQVQRLFECQVPRDSAAVRLRNRWATGPGFRGGQPHSSPSSDGACSAVVVSPCMWRAQVLQ